MLKRTSFLCIFLMATFLNAVAYADRDMFTQARHKMVEEQIKSRGVTDEKVINAMNKIPRHLFVPEDQRMSAYEDGPLPIGYGQTISQPYVVAYMTEAAKLGPGDRVLEIGTGSGYQAAVLAEIVKEVYTIEILEPLARSAQARLKKMGYGNVKVKCGDGYTGWPEFAPFDAIIVTAAPSEVPEELLKQLKLGGRMVVPVGSVSQDLYLIVRTDSGFSKTKLLPVAFVPMVSSDAGKM